MADVQPTRGNQLDGVILREGAGLRDVTQSLNNASKQDIKVFLFFLL